MRLPTRTGLLFALAVAMVALPTVATGGTSAPSGVNANTATFTDSTGEDPAAPDITTIVVSNDDAGMLSFRINIPNRPQLGQDMYCSLFVDTDNNPATGSPDLAGVDYVFQLIQGEINLFKWDGTDFTRRFGDPSAVTLSFSVPGRDHGSDLGCRARQHEAVELPPRSRSPGSSSIRRPATRTSRTPKA